MQVRTAQIGDDNDKDEADVLHYSVFLIGSKLTISLINNVQDQINTILLLLTCNENENGASRSTEVSRHLQHQATYDSYDGQELNYLQ